MGAILMIAGGTMATVAAFLLIVLFVLLIIGKPPHPKVLVYGSFIVGVAALIGGIISHTSPG